MAAEVIDSDLLYYFEEYTGELPSGADKAWMAHWSDILGASKVSEAILAARNAMAVYPVKYATAILESWRELNPRG